MMPFPKRLRTHTTLEFLFAFSSIGVLLEITFVMGAHVIHQVACHAETDIAFGTNVLCGELEGTDCGGKQC